ncbi:unnamed protein product [Effrenium voratum]|uniref:Sel1 repeat family protein n=1 Tax=Effrenium voratum TaxID=2562239 RepID=A0AA36NCN7_9DINO|nr:unnamed protein product [Effrenium voratum]
MGDTIYLGANLVPDAVAAVRYFLQAAEAGHAEAANELGVMYLTGEGAPPDEAASAYWFQKGRELEVLKQMEDSN